MKKYFVLILFLSVIYGWLNAQIVEREPYMTINTGRNEILCVSVSPNGDLVAVGTGRYAMIYDLEKGKKRFVLEQAAPDGDTRVCYVLFSPNGEYVCTIDYKGKRKVWSVQTGEEDKYLKHHVDWLPTPDFVKTELKLYITNKAFDRHDTQLKSQHPRNKNIVAVSAGTEINFENHADGSIEQDLKFPDTKNKRHKFPVYFSEDGSLFITGSDRGEVYCYKVKGRGAF